MNKSTGRRTQIQFTPTPELREIIETEAERMGISVSAFIRLQLLDVFREKIEAKKGKADDK